MAEAAKGAVVVTGASTGIGNATARHLGELGFAVYGGVRGEGAAEELRSQGIEPLRVDVTDEAQVREAAARVAEATGGKLAGLVNNAGIAISAPVELVPLDRLRQQLEVNLVGQVAAIQAFLPQLRAARGRIVNVSSIGGLIALPLVGPYAASKFGLEAISDSLRRELREHGVGVSVIEPGAVKTPIWDKGTAAADSMMDEMGPDAGRLYGGLIEAIRKRTLQAQRDGVEPEEVARRIGHALTASRPKTRYLVGSDARQRARIARIVPDRVFDALVARLLRA